MNKLYKSTLLVTYIIGYCECMWSSHLTRIRTLGSHRDYQLQTPTQNLIISQPNVTTTPLPDRPPYSPGELVDYIAQTGDTLTSLASHFNTTVDEISDCKQLYPC